MSPPEGEAAYGQVPTGGSSKKAGDPGRLRYALNNVEVCTACNLYKGDCYCRCSTEENTCHTVTENVFRGYTTWMIVINPVNLVLCTW